MSYNSLVWTPEGDNIHFDANYDNISPGFRFGYPTIEPVYYDTTTAKFTYLMVTPSGGRVEFRQTTVSNVYETADSSYVQLAASGASNPNEVENLTITVTGTDGSRMFYIWKGGAFRCSQITDRNGNYIQINHDDDGLLRTVTDTLGRVITVEYDGYYQPAAIKQTWKSGNGEGSDVVHTWASFSYRNETVTTNFGSLNVFGPENGTVLRVLEKVTYADLSSTKFYYNGYTQVKQIENFAPNGDFLNHVRTNLDSVSGVQSDCPRFTRTYNKVVDFNGGLETMVENSIPATATYDTPAGTGSAALIEVTMTNHPHNAVSKIYVGSSGWREGLPVVTEDWADGARKRWTWTNYTQDDPNLTYILNPRVIESRVGDAANVKKTSVEYLPISQGSLVALYGLVKKVEVGDLSTVLKRVETDYNLSTAYTSRRIIGLPSEVRAYGYENGSLPLVSKVTYVYDGENFAQESNQIIDPIMQDAVKYGSTFVVGRGNLTSIIRHEVSTTATVISKMRYDNGFQITPAPPNQPESGMIRAVFIKKNTEYGNFSLNYPVTVS